MAIVSNNSETIKLKSEYVLLLDKYTFTVSLASGMAELIVSPSAIDIDNPAWRCALEEARDYAIAYDDLAWAHMAFYMHEDKGEFNIDDFQSSVLEDAKYLKFFVGVANRLSEQYLIDITEEARQVIWALKNLTTPRPPKLAPSMQHRPGYVYILRSVSGHYKIGRTIDPNDRIKTFTIKLPFEVEYELVVKHEDHVWLEKELHQRFQHCRGNGEWFNLSPEDIEALKKEYGDAT